MRCGWESGFSRRWARRSSINGEEIRLSVSIGISISTPAQQRPEDLLEEADTAMRRAQALGGSRCELFSETMHSRAASRLRLEGELQEALTKRQFRVFYQPIVQIGSGRITGFEALLRWQHPRKGLISPYEFMETAENKGLLGSAGQWLILEACRRLHKWMSLSPPIGPITMSANLSARQLADAGFVKEVEQHLRETGIEPSQLRLEFTEDVAAADLRLTEKILSNLRQLRVGVILDDFGSGNSSLIRLRELPVEAVKIDRSLIGRMLLDRGAADVVELILMIGRKLKLTVIAEGVESAKQVEHLRALGCDLAQGYYFSAPLEAKEAQRMLQEHGFTSPAKLARAAD
jgi:EAL domain-containing protein (putative c-di-GMP-specific phosphodiesterase class I)